jgi:hypothetical protein
MSPDFSQRGPCEEVFLPPPTPRPLDGRDASSRSFIGREVPIFQNFPNRHPFFEFKFLFNPFLKKVLSSPVIHACLAAANLVERAEFNGGLCSCVGLLGLPSAALSGS